MQLISLIENISHAMDGFQTDLILLDFSKAFDTVPHQHLLHKLQHYKINDLVTTWIKSWPVVVNGTSSSSVSVLSGVPQGTVLGPLLFLLYINDLTNEVSSIRLFADDCILYQVIKSKNGSIILQHDLNLLSQWTTVWQMKFNINKCVLIRHSRSPNPFQHNYYLDNHVLDVREEHFLFVTGYWKTYLLGTSISLM